jgi:hypothetical protein
MSFSHSIDTKMGVFKGEDSLGITSSQSAARNQLQPTKVQFMCQKQLRFFDNNGLSHSVIIKVPPEGLAMYYLCRSCPPPTD